MTFDEFLQAASGPLVAAIVGGLLSFVVEYWPQFGALADRYKRLVFMALCLVVPVAAALLRAALGYAALSFDPLIWQALVAGAAAGGIGTLVHARKLSG